MKRLLWFLICISAGYSADVVTVDPSGVTTVTGIAPATAPGSGEVKIGGGDVQIGRTTQASGAQAVRGDDPRVLPSLWKRISDPVPLAISSASSPVALNRFHIISGTLGDYTIGLPPAPNVGDVVGFNVLSYAAANKVYTIDAGNGVLIAGRSRFLALVHTNSALFYWEGSQWLSLSLNLDTIWVSAGPMLLSSLGTQPNKGTVAIDKVWWRRQQSQVQLRIEFIKQVTDGTSGSGNYLITIPNGWIADGQQAQFDSSYPTLGGLFSASVVGSGWISRPISGSAAGPASVNLYDASRLRIVTMWTGGGVVCDRDYWSGSVFAVNSPLTLGLNCNIPLMNW